MSIGHWIVIAADFLFTGLNLAGIIFHHEDRKDHGVLATTISVIVLILFNIAAIAVR